MHAALGQEQASGDGVGRAQGTTEATTHFIRSLISSMSPRCDELTDASAKMLPSVWMA